MYPRFDLLVRLIFGSGNARPGDNSSKDTRCGRMEPGVSSISRADYTRLNPSFLSDIPDLTHLSFWQF